jgi:hypothetical protein
VSIKRRVGKPRPLDTIFSDAQVVLKALDARQRATYQAVVEHAHDSAVVQVRFCSDCLDKARAYLAAADAVDPLRNPGQ